VVGDLSAGDTGSGIVLVTVNYRLHVFGWLATEDLSAEQGGTSGNYGLQVRDYAIARGLGPALTCTTLTSTVGRHARG
jgi:hypothetical protein